MILLSFLTPGLFSLVWFVAAVGQLPFVGYWVRVDCGCYFHNALFTPIIIASKIWFCPGFTLSVVTVAVALVVLLFLLC